MELTQESYSGATLADYWNPTAHRPVPLRAQGEAVTPDTDLATIQLGGNPTALDNVAPRCLPTLVGSSTGYENVAGAVDAGAYSRDYAAVVRDVQARAPQARVLVVGYPNIVGDRNQTCPEVGFSTVSDRAGVEAYIAKLNSVGRDVAAQTGAVCRARGGHRRCVCSAWSARGKC